MMVVSEEESGSSELGSSIVVIGFVEVSGIIVLLLKQVHLQNEVGPAGALVRQMMMMDSFWTGLLDKVCNETEEVRHAGDSCDDQ